MDSFYLYYRKDHDALCTHILLERRANVNACNSSDETPLHLAIKNGNKAAVSALVQFQHCDLNSQDKSGNTPLHTAVLNNKNSIISEIVGSCERNAIDPTLCNKEGFNLLHLACSKNNTHLSVKKLIDKYPGLLEIQNPDGWFPLHLAVVNNQYENVKTILQSGHCNIDLRNEKKKQTALFLAVSQGYRDIIELLVEKKADANAADDFGNTPLHVAVRKHCMCPFEGALLNKHSLSDPNIKNLDYAIAVFLVLHGGADVACRNHTGQTPLEFCTDGNLFRHLTLSEQKTSSSSRSDLECNPISSMQRSYDSVPRSTGVQSGRAPFTSLFTSRSMHFPFCTQPLGRSPIYQQGSSTQKSSDSFRTLSFPSLIEEDVFQPTETNFLSTSFPPHLPPSTETSAHSSAIPRSSGQMMRQAFSLSLLPPSSPSLPGNAFSPPPSTSTSGTTLLPPEAFAPPQGQVPGNVLPQARIPPGTFMLQPPPASFQIPKDNSSPPPAFLLEGLQSPFLQETSPVSQPSQSVTSLSPSLSSISKPSSETPKNSSKVSLPPPLFHGKNYQPSTFPSLPSPVVKTSPKKTHNQPNYPALPRSVDNSGSCQDFTNSPAQPIKHEEGKSGEIKNSDVSSKGQTVNILEDLVAVGFTSTVHKSSEEQKQCTCEEREADVIFEPCNHKVVCKDCAFKMKRCPKCDNKIKNKKTTDGSLLHYHVMSPQKNSEEDQRLRELERKIECPICMDRDSNITFSCGHTSCQQCSFIEVCPSCSKKITDKRPLYL